jgi:hypothetical protein
MELIWIVCSMCIGEGYERPGWKANYLNAYDVNTLLCELKPITNNHIFDIITGNRATGYMRFPFVLFLVEID